MTQEWIFLPLLAQVLLTAVVWLVMGVGRFRGAKAGRFSLGDFKTAHRAQAALQTANQAGASDHFRNLFEMPVLFYSAVVTAYVLGVVSPLLITLAALYVLLRVVHAGIHLSYNNVIHRFYSYLASTCVLWVIWALLAIAVYQRL